MSSLIRCLAAPALAALLAAPFAGPASAQIVETRSDDANPMVSVFKSTLYGGGAGTLLGLAIAVADNDDDGNNGDAIRWGFVAGTFFGFAYGIYHVSTRPQPRALLQGGPGRAWALAPPDIRISPRRGASVSLLAYRF